jgi:hypothetical protein
MSNQKYINLYKPLPKPHGAVIWSPALQFIGEAIAELHRSQRVQAGIHQGLLTASGPQRSGENVVKYLWKIYGK